MTQRFILVSGHVDTRPKDDWLELCFHNSFTTIFITPKGYINDTLLPTFTTKTHRGVDPQFKIDFDRAAPISPGDDRARSWFFNGEPMKRSSRLFVHYLQHHHTQHVLDVTRLFNQRLGIDLTRRLQETVGDQHIVLPNSKSFKLYLTHLDQTPQIKASAHMNVRKYSAHGDICLKEKRRLFIQATYNLDDGTVLYECLLD